MRIEIKASLLFWLLVFGAPYSYGCEAVAYNASQLGVGKLQVIKVFDNEILIYRRTPEQIEAARGSISNITDRNYPEWWPVKNTPIDGVLATKRSRSLTDEYFVAWNVGPVYGYNLIFFPDPAVEPSRKGSWPAFLGSDWKGGLVDVVHMIAYDFTGRVYSSDPNVEEPNKGGVLRQWSLLVPKYAFDKSTKVFTFMCES